MHSKKILTPLTLGIAGPSGSGKTTLIERLIPLLLNSGKTVSTLKHVHHDIELDKPGKDSFRHRQAGAHQVMISLPSGWALFSPETSPIKAELHELVKMMAPVDLVLVEGYRSLPIKKIEVFNSTLNGTLNQPFHSSVMAVAADISIPNLSVPMFNRNDIGKISNFIVTNLDI